MGSPKKANIGSNVNVMASGEAYDAATAPTLQGRGNATKAKEANPGASAHQPRKRMFDRHDGTGRGHETEKKHGGGRGNWGVEGEEQLEDIDLAVQQSLARDADLDAAGPQFVSGEDAPGEEDALTLDEYEAQQAQRQAGGAEAKQGGGGGGKA